MTEAFLQFIWEQRLFDAGNLRSAEGEKIRVIEPGQRNYDSGPDFFNAKVEIGETIWAGNIEVHQNSSDWHRHRHQDDISYDNIILHVVNHFDQPVYRGSGQVIPTLEMTYPCHLLENYQQLLDAKTWIPCQSRFHAIDPFVMKIGFNRLMVERLQEKTSEISSRLKQTGNDWDETFYRVLSVNFGFRTNALPFDLLSKSLPVNILRKHCDNLFQLEALLFGQSGLLHEELLGDDYFLALRNEYGFLSVKYGLRPVAGHLWKFMRLRPANFPTVRIAQLAALIQQTNGSFSGIAAIENPGITEEIYNVRASEYWETHFRFSHGSRKQVKRLGTEAVNNIAINTIIPFLFVYGELTQKNHLKDRALDWLDRLPPENNSVIRGWQELGVNPGSALETQALLQLKNRYCQAKRCLECHVGNKLIRYNSAEV
jgi:hypothetical protein